MDVSAPFQRGLALLRDKEIRRIPEERSISTSKDHFQDFPDNHASLNK